MLVDAHWVASRLNAGGLCVLDTSWHASTSNRNAAKEFEASHIPSARFLGLSEIADPESDLAHTLPSAEFLAGRLAAVGARRDRPMVVYDDAGMSPSCRACWVFKTFGFDDIHVLDGGLKAWKDAGLPVESGTPAPLQEAIDRLGGADVRRVTDHKGVKRALGAGEFVLDARAAPRFLGQAPEPVAGIRSGHIEGSRNLPYQTLLDPASGRFRPASELRARFAEVGLDLSTPVICTCGSGVTACVLAVALESLGHPAVAVYDGSWTDWARRTSQERGLQ